jgi:mannose/fructose/N-acetylgalactosamine-specific phosphotransferase system component IIB
MSTVFYRLDERLIHGQVVAGWANALGVDGIILANDKVANNPWERELYLACFPPEVKGSILTIEQAAKSLSDGALKKQKIMLVVNSPADILKMKEVGVKIEGLNVGGMYQKPGRIQILPYLYLSIEEIIDFKKLIDQNVKCLCLDVPLGEKKDLKELLDKLNL